MHIDIMASLALSPSTQQIGAGSKGEKSPENGLDFLSMLQQELGFGNEVKTSELRSRPETYTPQFSNTMLSFRPPEMKVAGSDSEKSGSFRAENGFAKTDYRTANKKANMEDSSSAQASGRREDSSVKPASDVAEENQGDELKSAVNRLKKLLEEDEAANADLNNLLMAVPEEVVVEIITSLRDLEADELAVLAENPQELGEKILEILTRQDINLQTEVLENLTETEAFADMLGLIVEIAGLQKESQITVAEETKDAVWIEAGEHNEDALTKLVAALNKAAEATQAGKDNSAFNHDTDAAAKMAEIPQRNHAADVSPEIAKELATEAQADNMSVQGETEEPDTEQQSDGEKKKAVIREEKPVQTEVIQETEVIKEPGLRARFKEALASEMPMEEAQGESISDEMMTSGNKIVSGNSAVALEQVGAEGPTGNTDIVEKFLGILQKKLDGKTSNLKESATYGSSGEAKRSAFAENGGNKGSSGHGFSSGQGSSSSLLANQKAQNPVMANNRLFAEMLEKAEYLKTRNGSKILNLEMDPDHLGKVEMELISRDGSITARLSAESDIARARLEELAPHIKEQLENQGVNLSQITVDVSSKNPDERRSDQLGKIRNKSRRLAAEGIDDAEAIIRKNVLPNLRRAALNIKAVDVTV